MADETVATPAPAPAAKKRSGKSKTKKAPVPKGKGRTSAYAGKKIYRKTKDNPYRPGTNTHASFAAIRDGVTYETYREKTGAIGRLHLANAIAAGHVEVK